MRNKFEEQLKELNNMIIEMGAIVEDSISTTVEALLKKDAELVEAVVAAERLSDQKEKDIESLCLKLLLQQQPVARDLRIISAALKMVTDLERICDQARDICEILGFLENSDFIKPPEDIARMADETKKMLKNSIDSFVNRDLDLAKGVLLHDDIIDELFMKIRQDLIGLIHENAANGDQALDLLMIAKYFERIGDHTVNLAEWVIFMITGKHRSGEMVNQYRKY